MNYFECGSYRLSLENPLVMGIVNLTPDSFSGDGILANVDAAIMHARKQLDEGAAILDIGAESSRPGAKPTPLNEELDRLLPVLEEISAWGVPISVDTYKPEVMAAAIKAGASMVNDITGLTDPAALKIVAGSACGVCVMHMQGAPRSMQLSPRYENVVCEVAGFLREAVSRCRMAGIAAPRIVLDPGFGFGKTLQHNLALFQNLDQLTHDGLPMLVGVSRKSMLGALTGRSVEARVAASVVAAALAAERGAKILRVHDVAATVDALRVVEAVCKGGDFE